MAVEKRGPLSGLSLLYLAAPLFQVWVIANKVQGSHGLSRGTVCRRVGVQPREPKGQGWDYGIGVSTMATWDCFKHGGWWEDT